MNILALGSGNCLSPSCETAPGDVTLVNINQCNLAELVVTEDIIFGVFKCNVDTAGFFTTAANIITATTGTQGFLLKMMFGGVPEISSTKTPPLRTGGVGKVISYATTFTAMRDKVDKIQAKDAELLNQMIQRLQSDMHFFYVDIHDRMHIYRKNVEINSGGRIQEVNTQENLRLVLGMNWTPTEAGLYSNPTYIPGLYNDLLAAAV